MSPLIWASPGTNLPGTSPLYSDLAILTANPFCIHIPKANCLVNELHIALYVTGKTLTRWGCSQEKKVDTEDISNCQCDESHEGV